MLPLRTIFPYKTVSKLPQCGEPYTSSEFLAASHFRTYDLLKPLAKEKMLLEIDRLVKDAGISQDSITLYEFLDGYSVMFPSSIDHMHFEVAQELARMNDEFPDQNVTALYTFDKDKFRKPLHRLKTSQRSFAKAAHWLTREGLADKIYVLAKSSDTLSGQLTIYTRSPLDLSLLQNKIHPETRRRLPKAEITLG